MIPGLRGFAGTLVFLAWMARTRWAWRYASASFSTFAALPLVNIHDLLGRRPSAGAAAASGWALPL